MLQLARQLDGLTQLAPGVSTRCRHRLLAPCNTPSIDEHGPFTRERQGCIHNDSNDSSDYVKHRPRSHTPARLDRDRDELSRFMRRFWRCDDDARCGEALPSSLLDGSSVVTDREPLSTTTSTTSPSKSVRFNSSSRRFWSRSRLCDGVDASIPPA
jgi:hypothetical protein